MNIKDKHAIRSTTAKLLVFAMVMFAFCMWVMPPLYTLFCELTGLNGKTDSTPYTVVNAEVDTSRTVRVKFIATKHTSMPWAFAPDVFSIDVHPGQAVDTKFLAHNPTKSFMAGQAVPSMAPKNATDYFHKTECFCFNQQILAPGETAELGLQFIVDQALPKAVKTITLSYTLFDVSESSEESIEQVRQAKSLVGMDQSVPSAERSIANL